MYHKTKALLKLSEEEEKTLERITASRTEEYMRVERAEILIAHEEEKNPKDIAISVNTNK